MTNYNVSINGNILMTGSREELNNKIDVPCIAEAIDVIYADKAIRGMTLENGFSINIAN